MTQPICLWSGPRNVSTALMYSFAQRDDIRVVDEPLYGHYLRVSGAPHPDSEGVMAAMNCDGSLRCASSSSRMTASPSQFIAAMTPSRSGCGAPLTRR